MNQSTYEIQNGVAYITFNRSKLLNSFNREMALEVQSSLDKAESDNKVRCIVITGEGRGFCAGQDLAEATGDDAPELATIVKEHYNPIILRLRKIEKPIIAAVNGVAAGAGANIALACDIVIATASAKFIQAFSQIGLIPDSGGTYFLPRIVGHGRASALAFLAERINAKKAEEMGMIWKSVEDDNFKTLVQETAEKLAKLPTKGIGLTKRLFNESWNNNLQDQLDREEVIQAEAGKSHDYNEGVAAFLEKRPPNFKGV